MLDYIDLNIIERQLHDGIYYGTFSFLSDVRKIFNKAARYWAHDRDATKKAIELSKYFDTLAKEIENLPLKEEGNKGMEESMQEV